MLDIRTNLLFKKQCHINLTQRKVDKKLEFEVKVY